MSDSGADVVDATIDAGPPGTIATSQKAATQGDQVGGGDQNLTADGANDGTIEIKLTGPVNGLILVTTDANGMPAGGQQWDTVVLGDPLPDIGSGFTVGSQTWCLGVFENNTKVNDADGRISLAAGVHNLTLYGAESGFFVAGQPFRIWARDANTGNWLPGPTFTW